MSGHTQETGLTSVSMQAVGKHLQQVKPWALFLGSTQESSRDRSEEGTDHGPWSELVGMQWLVFQSLPFCLLSHLVCSFCVLIFLLRPVSAYCVHISLHTSFFEQETQKLSINTDSELNIRTDSRGTMKIWGLAVAWVLPWDTCSRSRTVARPPDFHPVLHSMPPFCFKILEYE